MQIYSVSSNTWRTSNNDGLAPLPQARGGMGTGVYLGGEIYVIGGETTLPSVPNGVYNRVDIYNPATNTWRSGPALPLGMHGMYPVTDGNSIYLTGGGGRSGLSSSSTFLSLQITAGSPSPSPSPASCVSRGCGDFSDGQTCQCDGQCLGYYDMLALFCVQSYFSVLVLVFSGFSTQFMLLNI